MKTINQILMVIMVFALTACGGGGGGGGGGGPTPGGDIFGCTDNAATNYNSAATVDDGTCTYGGAGGNGNASYYGFTTAGVDVSDNASAPVGANDLVIASQLYVEVTNDATRAMTTAVYQPTCPINQVTGYSALLVTDTAGANSVSFFIDSYSNKLRVTTHSYNVSNEQRYIRTSTSGTSDISYSCTNGKITATGGYEIYANGTSIVVKQGTNVYLGFASTTLLTNSQAAINATSFNFDSYSHSSLGSCDVNNGCNNPMGAGAGVGGLTSYFVTSGRLNDHFTGATNIDIVEYSLGESETGGMPNTYHAVVDPGNNNGYMTTVMSSVGGKKVMLGTVLNLLNCNAYDVDGTPGNDDGGAVYCTGSTALTIGIEP